jgi:peptidoglycan/LPS O-acetylase OafA/YrhL
VFLDLLRGFAATTVFISHAAILLWPNFSTYFWTYFDPGHFGVILFFLCSGFIVPASLERHRNLGRFWLVRIVRLYPLYWVCLLLFLAVNLAQGGRALPAEFHAAPLAFVAANLSMFQMLFGVPHLLGQSWTLMFELLFYLILSVQFVLGLGQRTLPLAAGILIGAIIVEGVVPQLGGPLLPNGILSLFGTLFTGAVLYQRYSGQISARTAAAFIALALLAETAALLGDAGRAPVAFAWLTARVAAYAVFLGALARQALLARCLGWVRGLGEISYSLYLMQSLVFVLVPPAPWPALTLLIWSAVLLALSALTYRTVEQPGIELGRRLLSLFWPSPSASVDASAASVLESNTPLTSH